MRSKALLMRHFIASSWCISWTVKNLNQKLTVKISEKIFGHCYWWTSKIYETHHVRMKHNLYLKEEMKPSCGLSDVFFERNHSNEWMTYKNWDILKCLLMWNDWTHKWQNIKMFQRWVCVSFKCLNRKRNILRSSVRHWSIN